MQTAQNVLGFLATEISRPDYQDKGIGKKLVLKVTDIYKDYLRIVVVGYDDEIGFYENCGFKKADDASPLFITDLWT